MNEYEVGQILFLANESSFKIIPVQVIEEVIRTTIEGQSKTYLVKFPNKDRSVVDINDLKYKHFKNESEVRSYLIENTTKAIDDLVKSANIIKKEVFGDSKTRKIKEALKPDIKSVQKENKDDIIRIDLGNGQIGNFKSKNISTEK
tara:strand:+ start:94 stop:531 length:438 start_codon:yes stop_codon:yes gene_type:complete